MTLLDAYNILYPESNQLNEVEHYISLSIRELDFYDWWFPYVAERGKFTLIWRPSICDPIDEDNEDYFLGFDVSELFEDGFPLGEYPWGPEDEGDYEDEEEFEDE